MGKSCCAVGCTNRFTKGSSIHFYRFPDDPARRVRWISAVNRKDWAPNEHSWICSEHFISGEKSNDSLSPDYVPSTFKHLPSPLKRKRARGMERYERLSLTKKRKDTEVDKQSAAAVLLALSEDGNGTLFCEPHTGLSCSTVLSMTDIDSLEARCMDFEKQNECYRKKCHDLEEECQGLLAENAIVKKDLGSMTKECTDLREANTKLRESIKRQSLTKQSFENDDSKVKYYTGLPYFARLIALFTFVSASISDSSKTILSPSSNSLWC